MNENRMRRESTMTRYKVSVVEGVMIKIKTWLKSIVGKWFGFNKQIEDLNNTIDLVLASNIVAESKDGIYWNTGSRDLYPTKEGMKAQSILFRHGKVYALARKVDQ